MIPGRRALPRVTRYYPISIWQIELGDRYGKSNWEIDMEDPDINEISI